LDDCCKRLKHWEPDEEDYLFMGSNLSQTRFDFCWMISSVLWFPKEVGAGRIGRFGADLANVGLNLTQPVGLQKRK